MFPCKINNKRTVHINTYYCWKYSVCPLLVQIHIFCCLLQWATSCSSQQFASQSFQICRALKISLSTSMLREVLTRLAESASDQSDELQNYAIEIFMTLENAIDNTEDEVLHPSQLYPEHPRQTSDITASLRRGTTI